MPDENPHLGSTLESVLREDGTYEDAKSDAIKSVLAYKLEQAMKDQKLSKTRMAERMETSRSQLDRLLDPEDPGSYPAHTQARRDCRDASGFLNFDSPRRTTDGAAGRLAGRPTAWGMRQTIRIIDQRAAGCRGVARAIAREPDGHDLGMNKDGGTG